MKQLLKTIESRYEQILKKIDIVQKSFERNLQEIAKLSEATNKFENRNEEILNKIKDNNMKMCIDIRELMIEVNVKQNKISYSDIVRRRTAMSDVGKRAALII